MRTANARRYPRTVFLVAGLASLAAAGLAAFRVLYSGQLTYTGLVWNLFLAWVPWLCAWLAETAYRRAGRVTVLVILYGLVWLLFFPNAPYIVTDLLHLAARPPVPLWFDLFLIFSFAWAGLFLGFSSLYAMQRLVTEKANRALGWIFVLAVLALSSFGIYLGRFLGWNSWDVLVDPRGLADDILSRLVHPFSYPRTMAVSALATMVFTVIYLTLYALARMPREESGEGRPVMQGTVAQEARSTRRER